MDFHLTKEQLLVRKMYREFAENEVKPLAAEIDEEERFPMETVEKMAKLGMMGIYFPKEYGGAGGDVLSYAMCVEELARSAAPLPLSFPLIPLCAALPFSSTAPRLRSKSICLTCCPARRSVVLPVTAMMTKVSATLPLVMKHLEPLRM